jgi:hypothetical protein
MSEPKPICPFMSGAPLAEGNPVIEPGRVGTVMIRPMRVECAEENCALWDRGFKACSIRSVEAAINDLTGALTNFGYLFKPPSTGGSPLMRIANSLEALVQHQAERKKGG